MSLCFPILSAEEAATLIQDGQTVGFSGFTPAGTPKAIPVAIAQRAEAEHRAGRPYQLGVLSGASTGPSIDGALASADAIAFRAPFQSDPILREQINTGNVRFVEMHISMFPQALRYGVLGPLHWAVVEACDVTPGGGIVLSTSVGATPTLVDRAERVLIELNRRQPWSLLGLHDIFEPEDPPTRNKLPIYKVEDRVGTPILSVPPSKIAGVVVTNCEDEGVAFAERTAITDRIGQNVAEFLLSEWRAGRIPPEFLPLQSGLGNTGNAVLAAMAECESLPDFTMFTEVIQDATLNLLERGRCRFASASALALSPVAMRHFFAEMSAMRSRVVLRPQEICNHPELIRRLGVISINTALEVDIVGNVNSTHIYGRQLMNGIGGSGDFTRNAYLSIFCCPSTRLGQRVSTIVPMVTHVDHTEHSVQVVITEHGIADLRGCDPAERARLLISRCAHPDYRNSLLEYCKHARGGHSPFSLRLAYAMHEQFALDGDMRGVCWSGSHISRAQAQSC